MADVGGKRTLSVAAFLLAFIVLEKLTVLHLPAHWLLGAVHDFGGAPIAYGLALVFFGGRRIVTVPLRPRWSRQIALVHAVVLGCLLALELWYSHNGAILTSHPIAFWWMASVWTALIPLAVATLLLTVIPPESILPLLRRLALPSLAAAVVTAALLYARHLGDHAWATSSAIVRLFQQASFRQTRSLLQIFYPVVISNPDHQILGTPRYIIQVSWLCSGLEGLLLVSVLIALWIFFFRRELILRRAIAVAPIALMLTWVANIIRLAILIAIGDHGHAQLADLGFHTQAGWLSLNLIVLGSLAAVQNAAWFRKQDASSPAITRAVDVNYIAVYVLPFTLTLAASLITQGLAEGFEIFYPLRIAFALSALYLYRREYKRMDWRFGPTGLAAGVAIGVLWLVVHSRMHIHTPEVVLTANALSAATRVERWGWILLRVFGATVTVPIAEELAFRGFAARRVQRVEFETVPYRTMTWLSLVVSSAAFGALHGRMWILGILSGAVFWAVARYKNRLGEAVAAHAAANGVIAIVAVLHRDYSLW